MLGVLAARGWGGEQEGHAMPFSFHRQPGRCAWEPMPRTPHPSTPLLNCGSLSTQATGDASWEPGKPIYRFDSGSDRVEIFLEFN